VRRQSAVKPVDGGDSRVYFYQRRSVSVRLQRSGKDDSQRAFRTKADENKTRLNLAGLMLRGGFCSAFG